MSYVEHGPRIFLAGRQNDNMPLACGNYVLPKKRLEGRLKVYDSCSDIRAWSPNPIESSQYFRELTEHAAPPGKIIPFNVVIENIIGLTSQAQNELEDLRQELNRYKSLKLTPEQEKYLRTFDDEILAEHLKEKHHKNSTLTKQSLKDGSKVINKSTSLPHLNSYLSIQINPETNCHYNDRYYQNLSLFSHIDSVSPRSGYLLSKLKSIYISSKIENAKRNKYKDMESDLANLEDKDTQVVCVEYADISVQVMWDMHEIGTQTDRLMEYATSSETKIESQSSICKYNNESRNHIKKGFSTESYIETESESSSIIESDFDIEVHERSHKEIIIQKDSEIIALKNELGVKEAEIEELKEVNRNLEIILKKKDENLNTLQGGLKILKERFTKLNEQRHDELTDMEKKLYTNACIMEQLKVELNKKSEVTFLQSKEIEKLRVYVKEVAALVLERDALMEKVKEMERLSKEAENCRDALEQLKEALHEKDELQKRNQEQNCLLADQEDEIKHLLTVIQEMSSSHNDQKHRMNSVLEELRAKLIEKDNTISKYEEQLHCMEQEINEFTIKLKNNLNNLEEFKLECEDIYSNLRCKHDTCERTKRKLYTVSALMEEIQKSKIEDKESLQQIGTEESISSCHLNYYCNSCSSISQVDEPNMIMVKQIQTSQRNLLENTQLDYIDNEIVNNKMMHEYIDVENHSNKDVSEPDSWNSAKTEVSTLTLNNYMNIETTIVEEVSRSLIKIQSLTEQLQVYAEKERPSLIKQNHDLYKNLMDSKPVIVLSPDATIKKQDIYELYNKYKKHYYEKQKSSMTTLNKDLQESSITEAFIKIILDQHVQEITQHDEYIDKIFTTQIKHSVEKIKELSIALQGAGDQRTQIVKEVEKKQQEILEKDVEIARLKKQVQMGEGDCIRQENSEWNVIKNNFKTLAIELSQKNQYIQELKDELQSNINECNELKQENKSLFDNKNVLLTECNTKNNELKEKRNEINQLIKEIQNLKESIQITNCMEKEIEGLKIKLNKLQEENTELRKKLGDANEIMWKNNELIRDLKDEQEKDQHLFELKHIEYEKLLTERQNLINNLEHENLSINKKLIDAENKILALNETISSLHEHNNEMKLLDVLQIDTTKLENDIKKLEVKSSKCKSELRNYANTNKANEQRLIAFTKENEIIKKNIQMLKDKLPIELAQETIANDELKTTLHTLSNELYNKIINLKKQVSQPDKYYSMHLKNNLHKDMDKDFEDEKYKSKQIENENTKQHFSKIRNLIHEIENKDLEIENLKNRVNCLSKENDELNKKLKYHKENYEDKLTILKRKYDSSISALHKKHKENIELLKMNFEEINGERIIFDSESWLQSLSIKELRDVYNRIFLLMNKLDINNDNKAMLDLTNKEELCGTVQNLSSRYEDSQKGDTLMEMQYDQMLQEEEMQNIKLQSLKQKDHNDSFKTLIQKQCPQDKNENKSKETIPYNTVWEKTMFFDLACDGKKTKYDSNSRVYNDNINKQYASQDIMSIPATKTKKANTIDVQRKNFIYQCSVHHKKSNIC